MSLSECNSTDKDTIKRFTLSTQYPGKLRRDEMRPIKLALGQ